MFNTYFTAKHILSKGALLNVVLSDRSDGKTFDSKADALKQFELDGSVTVYMRRYKTEITEKLYQTFFDEVINIPEYMRFALWSFRGSKKGIEVKKQGEKEWKFIVYFVPLSMSGKLKSQLEVRKIKRIYYDEFVPLDGKYLPNECDLILEFWKSVDRDRDTTQMVILGNKITPFNPLFDFFDIDLDITGDKIRLYKNGTLAVQIYSNKEHREIRNESKFNKLVKETKYDDYNSGGILQALSIKIINKQGADYLYSFKTKNGEGSIWYKNGSLLISTSLRKDGYILTDTVYNTEREQYTINAGKFKQIYKQAYNCGELYFESEKAFHFFEPILKKLCV